MALWCDCGYAVNLNKNLMIETLSKYEYVSAVLLLFYCFILLNNICMLFFLPNMECCSRFFVETHILLQISFNEIFFNIFLIEYVVNYS